MSTTQTEQTAVRYDKDADGIVTLTLDDPTASANTMNELYIASMAAAVDRLYAEAESVTGVVVTSAKKTFFAGGNLNEMVKATPADAQLGLRAGRAGQGRAAAARDLPQAGRGRGQRRRARRGPGDRAWPATTGSPSTAATTSGCPRRASGCCQVAAASPGRPDARHPERADGRAAPGHPFQAGRRPGEGAGRRAGGHPGRAGPGGEGLAQGQPRAVQNPWDAPGYKMPGGIAEVAGAGRLPAGVPGAAAQAAQGRGLPGAAGDPLGRGRGRPGRLRHRGRIESRYLTHLIVNQGSKNMIQAFFFDLQAINAGKLRPQGIEP